MPLAFAEQPTHESLALEVETLERPAEAPRAEVDAATREKDGNADHEKARRPELIIYILKDGRIRVDGQDLKDEELVARIKLILKRFPNQPIRIRGDANVKYQEVVRVIDLCQRAGP